MSLAYMLHSKKSAFHHEAFGEFFGKHLQSVCSSNKRVPILVTDGERSLGKLVKVLGCDLTLLALGNIFFDVTYV